VETLDRYRPGASLTD